MKKITLLLLISIFMILAACSTAPEELALDQVITSDNPALQDLEHTDEAGGNPKIPVDIPAKNSIADQFQTIYIDPDQVKILDSSMVEWPDSCLGIEQLGTECIPELTPGYAVLLEAKGLKFAYHSNEVGSLVHPATQGLIWIREDGTGSICDRLIIYLPDTAYACWCDSGEMHATSVNLQEILSEEEYQLLIDSLTTFSENTFNQPSTDGSNPVMVSLTFNGQGTTIPNADQQDSLVTMAELIFSRIIP